MVSSAILCLLLSARDVTATEGPVLGAVTGARCGEELLGERLLGLVEPPQDRAVVEVGADPYADAADDPGVDVDLQRDLAAVDVGQLGTQALLLGVVEGLGDR